MIFLQINLCNYVQIIVYHTTVKHDIINSVNFYYQLGSQNQVDGLCFVSHRYIFTIVSYLIGVFIFATIVGQVGNVITNRNANRLEFERLLDGAKTYMRHHKVSTLLVHSMIVFKGEKGQHNQSCWEINVKRKQEQRK